MSVVIRRQVPLAITFLIGVYMLFEYYFVLPSSLQNISTYIQNFGVIMINLSLGLGAIVTISSHVRKISRRITGQWIYSVCLIATFILFVAVGFIFTTLGPEWKWLYESTMLPLYATTYSMWVFYMTSGAYRAFRARNVESAILLFSGSIVMLGNVPIGGIIWDGFPLLRDWIMSVPNMAANRGIIMGAALGAMILALRVLVGRETSYLGTREE
jgi:hypothetical protein